MWRGLNIVEAARGTPLGDGRDIDVEHSRGGFGTVAPVAALTTGTGPWCLWAGAGDMIGIADPVHFACGERAASTGHRAFAIELFGDLGKWSK